MNSIVYIGSINQTNSRIQRNFEQNKSGYTVLISDVFIQPYTHTEIYNR